LQKSSLERQAQNMSSKQFVHLLIGCGIGYVVYLILRAYYIGFNDRLLNSCGPIVVVLILALILFLLVKQHWWIIVGLSIGTIVIPSIQFGIAVIIEVKNSQGWLTYTATTSSLQNNYIAHAQVDQQNRVWMGTGYGLSVITSDGKWTTYTTATLGLIDNYINAVLIDSAGSVWSVGRKGVSKLDSQGQWVSYKHDIPDPELGPQDRLAIDQKNRLWVGRSTGLYVLEADGKWIVNHPTTLGAAARGITVTGLTIDKQGQVWASTADSNTPDGKLNVLTADGRWTTRVIPGTNKFIPAIVLRVLNETRRDIQVDEKGQVWIAIAEGAARLEPDGTWTIFELPAAAQQDTGRTLLVDQLGRLWIGTSNTGLHVFTAQAGWTNYTVNNSGLAQRAGAKEKANAAIRTLALDQKGRLWIGTNNGLNVFDTNTVK
jgi:ligand-binding sensor domain-containing protein